MNNTRLMWLGLLTGAAFLSIPLTIAQDGAQDSSDEKLAGETGIAEPENKTTEENKPEISSISWEKNLADALAKAKESHKYVMLIVGSLDPEVWSDARVAAKVHEHFVPAHVGVDVLFSGEHMDIVALTQQGIRGQICKNTGHQWLTPSEFYFMMINEKGELLLRLRRVPFHTPETALTWFDDVTAAMTGVGRLEEANKADPDDMETARKLAGMYDILGRFKDLLPLLEKIIPKLSGPESFDTRIMYLRATSEWEFANKSSTKDKDKFKKTQEYFLPFFDELIKAKDERAVDLVLSADVLDFTSIHWKDPVDICDKLLSTFPNHTPTFDIDVLTTLSTVAMLNPKKGAKKYIKDALAKELAKEKPDEYTIDGLQDLLAVWEADWGDLQTKETPGTKPPAPPSEESNEKPEEPNEQPGGSGE